MVIVSPTNVNISAEKMEAGVCVCVCVSQNEIKFLLSVYLATNMLRSMRTSDARFPPN